jgi:hypothetical protein
MSGARLPRFGECNTGSATPRSGVLRSSVDVRIIMQNDVQQRTVDLQVAVVIN